MYTDNVSEKVMLNAYNHNAMSATNSPMKHSIPSPTSFSPVEAFRPGTKKVHTTGFVQKVYDSAVELDALLQEWMKSHNSGYAVLSSIMSLKTDLISKYGGNNSSLYPEGLQERCNELEKVIMKMRDIVGSMQLLTDQLTALAELHSSNCPDQSPLFISWPTWKFSQQFGVIYEAYSKELALKTAIKEEMAHSSKKTELLTHVASWQSQPYINNTIILATQSIFVETNLR